MKKTATVLAALALSMALVGCNGGSDDDEGCEIEKNKKKNHAASSVVVPALAERTGGTSGGRGGSSGRSGGSKPGKVRPGGTSGGTSGGSTGGYHLDCD